MNLKATIRIVILLSWFPVCSYSQSNSTNHKINIEIPEVALLGLVSDGTTNINLTSTSPLEAGNSINFADTQNSSIWINYSSIIAKTNNRRKVIAMVEGEMPEGIRLMVEASNVSGMGKGEMGESAGVVALSNQPSDIITDIGSCYTGKGIHNGRYLTYKLEMDKSTENYALLSQAQTSINVIYTLTDNN